MLQSKPKPHPLQRSKKKRVWKRNNLESSSISLKTMRNYIAFSALNLITLFYSNILRLICSAHLICVLGSSGLVRWATRERPEWPLSSIPSLCRWILHEVITGEIVWVPLQHDVFLCTHSSERAGSGRAPMARLMTACAWDAEFYRSSGRSKTVQHRGQGGQTLPESLHFTLSACKTSNSRLLERLCFLIKHLCSSHRPLSSHLGWNWNATLSADQIKRDTVAFTQTE